jgi:hypothetical protein
VSTKGDVSATFDSAADAAAEGENQWLDKASSAVESRLGDLGTDYLAILVEDFEARWVKHTSDAAEAASAKAAAAADTAKDTPRTKPGDGPPN